MEKQGYQQKQGRFLPYYFKYIGRGVGLLGLILFFSKLVVDVVNPYIGFGLMLTGIFLFAFSKEKIENENLMKKSQQLYQRGLQPPFPNYFKKIGAGTILFTIAVLFPASIWFKESNPAAFENNKQLFGILLIDIIYAGFLLYIGAKEKIEDELIAKVRLQSLAIAFIFGIVSVIMNPITYYILNNKTKNMENQNVILMMLVMYTIFFHFRKKNM